MEGHHLPDPTAEYGELFEEEKFDPSGETLGFENGIEIAVPTPTTASSNSIINQPGRRIMNIQFNSDFGKAFERIDAGRLAEGFQKEQKYTPTPIDIHSSTVVNNDIAHQNEKKDSKNSDDDQKQLMIPGNSSSEELVPKPKVLVTKNADYFVRVNLNKYLRNMGYRETVMPKTMDKNHFADTIRPETSIANPILFGANYKAEDMHEEFDKFLKFYQQMKIRNPLMSGEIKRMLLPILVFMFQEATQLGHVQIASKLLLDFGKKIMQEDRTVKTYLAIMSMGLVKTRKGNDGKHVKNFSEKVHKFVISEWTFEQLKIFLSKPKRNVLLNVLTNRFIIQVRSCQEIAEAFSSDNNEEMTSEESVDSDPTVTTKVSRAHAILHRLRGNVRANLPSISVFTTNGNPTCAAVSSEGSTFAFGLATSGVRIYPASSAKNLETCEHEQGHPESPRRNCSSSDLKTLSGHAGSVYGVKFHPRTKFLYSVGQDSEMRSWDLTNDKSYGCKAVYTGHLGPIWSVDITSSGQLIATGSSDTTARIWVPERTDCVRLLVGHYFDVDSVRFHPNETYLATGSVDKSVRLWSVNDGNMVRIFTGMEGKVSTLAFHASGKYVVGGGEEEMLRIWDIGEGEVVAELPCLPFCKDLSFQGNMLAACFRTGEVQLWNLRNIVGGDSLSTTSDNLVPTVPEPYVVKCHAKTLTNLWYKDVGSLYCLGSDPQPHLRVKTADDNIIINEEIQGSSSNTSCSNSINSYDVIENNDPDPIIPVISIPNLPPLSPPPQTKRDSPIFAVKFNPSTTDLERIDITKTFIPQTLITNNSSEISPMLMDEDICIEDADAENTNNTITSSDIEFEVDDQMLESFVDDSNSFLQA